jgi:hypothetical protein
VRFRECSNCGAPGAHLSRECPLLRIDRNKVGWKPEQEKPETREARHESIAALERLFHKA